MYTLNNYNINLILYNFIIYKNVYLLKLIFNNKIG